MESIPIVDVSECVILLTEELKHISKEGCGCKDSNPLGFHPQPIFILGMNDRLSVTPLPVCEKIDVIKAVYVKAINMRVMRRLGPKKPA